MSYGESNREAEAATSYIPTIYRNNFQPTDVYSFVDFIRSKDGTLRDFIDQLLQNYNPEHFVRSNETLWLQGLLSKYCSIDAKLLMERVQNKINWDEYLPYLNYAVNSEHYIPYLFDVYAPDHRHLPLVITSIVNANNIRAVKGWTSFIRHIISKGKKFSSISYSSSDDHAASDMFKSIWAYKHVFVDMINANNLGSTAIALGFYIKMLETGHDMDKQTFNFSDHMEQETAYNRNINRKEIYNEINDQVFIMKCLSLFNDIVGNNSHNLLYGECIDRLYQLLNLIISDLTSLLSSIDQGNYNLVVLFAKSITHCLLYNGDIIANKNPNNPDFNYLSYNNFDNNNKSLKSFKLIGQLGLDLFDNIIKLLSKSQDNSPETSYLANIITVVILFSIELLNDTGVNSDTPGVKSIQSDPYLINFLKLFTDVGFKHNYLRILPNIGLNCVNTKQTPDYQKYRKYYLGHDNNIYSAFFDYSHAVSKINDDYMKTEGLSDYEYDKNHIDIPKELISSLHRTFIEN